MKKLIPLLLFSLLFINGLIAHEKLVIIGKGPAGLSAAIYAGQAHLNPLIIEGSECDGQLIVVSRIENYPGFPEGISGEELIDRMRSQAENVGARFHNFIVTDVDLSQKPFHLTLNNGEKVSCDSIIIATGASPRWLNVPGEEQLKNKGVSASATCDAPLFKNKSVVVAGGGDAALEQALYLTEWADQVTIIHRAAQLNASSYLIERVLSNAKIALILEAKIEEILGSHWVKGITYQDIKTKQKHTLVCEGIFVSIGRKPNTDLFQGQLILDESGYIVNNAQNSETSVSGVFAAGDIIKNSYRKVVTAAASGCISAIDATKYLDLLINH